MQQLDDEHLRALLGRFCLAGEIVSVATYGNGHINDTYLVVTSRAGARHEYILQRLSPVAFRHPEQVMDNVVRVTDYLRCGILRRGGNPEREVLTLIPTVDGRYHVCDDTCACWRVYLNIRDTVSWQLPDSEAIFRESGRAFGAFQTALIDFPAAELHETIPHFHDTPRRIQALRDVIDKDPVGRVDGAGDMIDFALSRANRADALLRQLAAGELPLRVTHNDTKLNNVLMDAQTGRAQCVIDLDTVMPGLCAYDFGDAIRFGANTAAEDERDLTRVCFSLPMFRAYCEGYLAEAGNVLTSAEIASLPLGAWMMTYECGSRFLTDYLDGDHYFHVTCPDHNLVRARNQFALLRGMEQSCGDMQSIVQQWMKE